MLIRLARLTDVPAIYHLITQATQRGKILKRSLKEIEKAAHHFWVVEEQNKIIACCALEIYNKKLKLHTNNYKLLHILYTIKNQKYISKQNTKQSFPHDQHHLFLLLFLYT